MTLVILFVVSWPAATISGAAGIGGALLLFLGAAMVLGSWTGKRLIERLPQTTFRAAVELLLILSGLQLLVFA